MNLTVCLLELIVIKKVQHFQRNKQDTQTH